MRVTKGRLFIRDHGDRQMLLGIVLDGLPSLSAEHLHDVTIIDYDGTLTISIEKVGKPWSKEEGHSHIKGWRADQILTGAFRMQDEVDEGRI